MFILSNWAIYILTHKHDFDLPCSDYDELKHLLKTGTADAQFSEKHEAVFVEALERELEKVSWSFDVYAVVALFNHGIIP